ncbi:MULTISPECIES: DUF6328 family protein [Herbaspirillum]|jgi:fatty acid desaturase|uniref:Sodium:proton antiporter n=2 Tax=Herbaspirillum TaxID=963 RepID=A0A246WS60_9BURK|nr:MULTISPECIES: DUF6328 family protein [Herbaspirillum]MCP4031037.1 hypothetical protein [Herbaspirillum sp.]MDR9851400.1 DUF6328 family protein [Herbaspirillum huttiense SE1]MRT31020.1 hypothetical protein [Herbaspirillum sp. CAH-3]ONN63788.1 hypothetical protein BTM36_25470 [Herbaspirillum sp. VT-16-41]OWY28493.1 hypothetical protein CEJ42_14775 [Herbaspirillum robiniae]
MTSSHTEEDREDFEGDGDLSDLLNELRVLLPAAQLLTAFLITLPFNSGFSQIVESEKWIFLATFCCSLTSLVLFAAPAVQHRILRPLRDRSRFKTLASRQMLCGAVSLSFALVLASNLVVSQVFGHLRGVWFAMGTGVLIFSLWWLLPLRFLRDLSGTRPLVIRNGSDI